jgi:hypothetical protein
MICFPSTPCASAQDVLTRQFASNAQRAAIKEAIMMRLVTADYHGQFINDIVEMHRLRYRVFKERLDWDVCVSGDMEIDLPGRRGESAGRGTDSAGRRMGGNVGRRDGIRRRAPWSRSAGRSRPYAGVADAFLASFLQICE